MLEKKIIHEDVNTPEDNREPSQVSASIGERAVSGIIANSIRVAPRLTIATLAAAGTVINTVDSFKAPKS